MKGGIISVNKKVIKNEMKHEGVTLLVYKIEYPEFKAPFYQLSLALVNNFYRRKALEYQKYLESELFATAVKQYKDDIKNGFPVRVFEALLTYKLTYNNVCIVSLYFDKYEFTGGAHGNTLRASQTWNLQKCAMLKLPELYRCGQNYKEYFLERIIRQIRKNPEIYFDDYKKLAAQTFNPDSFYCTPRGIVLYYQQYDIAPYSSGIREFLMPYNNCVLNPAKKCFTI